MDTFGASGLTLLFIACCETIAVSWVYGNPTSDQYFQSLFLRPYFLDPGNTRLLKSDWLRV